jgi:ABC-type uncharacterized transport system involved in gliding motility auxiliary subunit
MHSNLEPRSSTRILSLMGLIVLLVGLLVMIMLPQIKLAAWGIMGLGVILLISALVLDFRKVSKALTGRRGRFGAGTTFMASIFLGIIIVVNGISVSAYKRFDVTKLSQFTLTEQTKDVLTKLDKPVKALCFFVPSKDTYGITTYAEYLLKEYMHYSDRISYEIIDPDESPERARKYGIFQYQSVVFEYGDNQRMVYPSQIINFDTDGNVQSIEAEHAFTSAILEVTGVVQKKVYFLTGHGEASLSGNYNMVLSGLRDDLYIAGELDLMNNPVIPEDTAVLVIASPRKPLMDYEITAINEYMAAGGQALIIADPGFPENLNQIVNPWGLHFDDGTVIDFTSSMGSNVEMPRVTGDNNYFSRIGLNIVSYFPGATGVTYSVNQTENYSALVTTSSLSWLDKDYDAAKVPVFSEDKGDVIGPITIGVVFAGALTEEQAKLTRIVVIGDSDFASNEHYTQVNNGDLFLNCVNWLAEETNLITIRRAVLPYRRLAVNSEQSNFIVWSSLALPAVLAILIGGIVLWYRRT